MRSTSPATTSDSRWRRAAGFLFPTRSQLWLRTNPTGWVACTALPLMVASEFSLRRRSQNAALSGAADSAVVVELVVYLAVAAFLVLSLVQPPNGRRIPALLLVMWGFTLAMLLAAFWSPFPLLATARGAQLVVAASLGHLVARYATANALSRLCHAYLIVVAVSVGIGLALPFPPLPQAGGRFTWLYVHPNVSGTFLAIAVAIALALLLRRRAGVVGAPWGSSLYAFVLAVDVGALLATRSRGSLVAAGLAVAAVALAAARRRSRADVVAFGGIALILAWLLAATDVLTFWNRGESAEKVSSLNSRLDVWEQAWQLFDQQPLLGHGFMSARGVFLDTFGLGGSHNAFIEVLVNSGVFGTVWWVALVLVAAQGAIRVTARRHPDGPVLIGVLAALVGSAMTAGGLGQAATVQNVWLFVIVGWIVAAPRLRWERPAPIVPPARPATPLLAEVSRPPDALNVTERRSGRARTTRPRPAG